MYIYDFMDFVKIINYTCNSEIYFQNLAISSFFISQIALRSWIIANNLEIIMSKEYCFNFEGKTVKISHKKAILVKNGIFCKFEVCQGGFKSWQNAIRFHMQWFFIYIKRYRCAPELFEKIFKKWGPLPIGVSLIY